MKYLTFGVDLGVKVMIFFFTFIWLLCGVIFSKIDQTVQDLSTGKYLTSNFDL